ncbi:MAG: tagaturonate epimerase family protein [Kineosporiaceae bacterium]
MTTDVTRATGAGARGGPRLPGLRNLDVRPASVRVLPHGVEVGATGDPVPRLALLVPAGVDVPPGIDGETAVIEDTILGTATLVVGAADSRGAAFLRDAVPGLAPRPLGLATSVGLGDRLGLATPGHVRAMRAAGAGDDVTDAVRPVLAQQSARENARTGRTPRQVLDDATIGTFLAGWRGAVGADADHLKTEDDVGEFAAAGFTMFTLDPGDHVVARPDHERRVTGAELAALPWQDLADTERDLRRRYPDRLDLGDRWLDLGADAVALAAVKYGRAVAHAARLYRHLAGVARGPVEVELAVDETATPTTPAQHVYLVAELTRLGVPLVSVAPRFVGTFEKGVGYRGDLAELTAELAAHAAVARRFGPYKLSLHSGSDKFDLYGPAAELTGGLVHLKTSGTSYLEALRTVAVVDPALFRELYGAARAAFAQARAGYHVSAELERTAAADDVADAALPALLDRDDERQVLHVTYGTLLRDPALGSRLHDVLRRHPDAHAAALERHLSRHVAPLVQRAGAAP